MIYCNNLYVVDTIWPNTSDLSQDSDQRSLVEGVNRPSNGTDVGVIDGSHYVVGRLAGLDAALTPPLDGFESFDFIGRPEPLLRAELVLRLSSCDEDGRTLALTRSRSVRVLCGGSLASLEVLLVG